MDYPKIDNWAVLNGSLVYGRIYSHKDIPDGTYITTPKVSDVYFGGFYTLVIVNTGHIYKLGQISDKYREWVNTNSEGFDPLKPVKIVSN